jgi:hypothetical protein
VTRWRAAAPRTAVPPDDADALTHLLFRQNNVISRRQALRMLTPSAIQHRLAKGHWQAAHRGIYLAVPAAGGFAGGLTDPQQRRWVASLSAGGGRPAPLAGLSALVVHGLRGFGESDVHVLVSAWRRDTDPPVFVVVHRSRELCREDVRWPASPPCTFPARSLVDAAQWARHDDRARAIVAAAFQQRLVAADDVHRILESMGRVRRRDLIIEAVADAAGGVHSLPEAEFVRLCRDAGLPRPTCQVRRTDAGGRRRYLDAEFQPWRIHVEIDGSQHMNVQQWWADMKRQNDLWVPGGRVLRFPSWAIRNRPDEVTATIRAALMAAGWRPPDLGV